MPNKADFLIEYLNQHESSPSACVLARTVYNNINSLPDDEVSEIYERNEWANDSERDELISKMTDAQLIEFYGIAVEVLLEKIAYLEEQQ